MITIVSGTNRDNSNSLKLAQLYLSLLEQRHIPAQIFDLGELKEDFWIAELYGNRTPEFSTIVEQFFEKADKWIYIFPEYNGSFPGVLKTFIDGLDPDVFKGKRVALAGHSGGKAGNLRGLDHMTGVLHYLQAEVLSDKPKLSQFHTLLTPNGELSEEVILRIQTQLDKFIQF